MVGPSRRGNEALRRVAAYGAAGTLLLTLLAGCSGADEPAGALVLRETPTPTETARAQRTATFTATASATAEFATEVSGNASPTATEAAEATATSTDTATSTATAEPTEDATAVVSAFQARANELVGGIDGMAGVYVGLPDGTMLFEANPGESIESASLYKLPIVVEVFRLREEGVLSFDLSLELREEYFLEEDSVYTTDSIGEVVDVATLLEHTVTLSSNVAAKALLAMTGNEAINETMHSLGLQGTEIRWSPSYVGLPSGTTTSDTTRTLASTRVDVQEPTDTPADLRADEALNVTTAGDMGLLFRKLLNGEVFSPPASQEILDLLKRQLINDRLPAYLPEDTVVAHKTGNLDGLVHDVGVVFAPASPVIVVCLLEAVDEGYAIEVIRELAAGAYQIGTLPAPELEPKAEGTPAESADEESGRRE